MTKEKTELTEKQEAFVRALFSEETMGNLSLSMKAAGYSEGTRAADILSSDAVAEAIKERAKYYLSANTAKAVFHLINSLDNPADPGIQNKLKSIQMILDKAGVKDREEATKDTIKAGIVILPEKKMSITVEVDDE